jgi:hypothetical protein
VIEIVILLEVVQLVVSELNLVIGIRTQMQHINGFLLQMILEQTIAMMGRRQQVQDGEIVIMMVMGIVMVIILLD